MDLILQFVNFVVGSLVEIYNNRAAYEAQKEAINEAWEQHFEESAAAQAQAEKDILAAFDKGLSEEVQKANAKATAIAAVMVVIAIIIAVYIYRKK